MLFSAMTDMTLEAKWKIMITKLNEKQRRYYLAFEAKALGEGGAGVRRISNATGISRQTIYVGIREIESGQTLDEKRVRRVGGGRKSIMEKDPAIIDDLDKTAEPKGNPDSPLKWTTKSFSNLRDALSGLGHLVGLTTVRMLLKACGYSLQSDRKNIEEEKKDPDRDKQFRHINDETNRFLAMEIPVISVDCKKRRRLEILKITDRNGIKRAVSASKRI